MLNEAEHNKNDALLFKKMLTLLELSGFFYQLSLLVKAGTSVFEALSFMSGSDGRKDGYRIDGLLGKTISFMAVRVEEGDKLFAAMALSGVFPDYARHMVEIGENIGRLDVVLESLAEYYEREQYLRVKIRNSLMYPMFLFIVMSVVIILLIGKIFPIFNDILNSLGGSLSEAENTVAEFSNSLIAGEYAMYIILALSALAVLIFLFSRTKRGNHIIGYIASVFPLTRNISNKIAASRFANAFSMTISSGMDIDTAMSFAVKLVSDSVHKLKFDKCVNEIKAGASFHEAIGKTGLFLPTHIKLIEIGNKTGEIDAVMHKIAEMCDDEAGNAIDNATSLVEPVLVGILSSVIGAVLIMVIIPLVNIMINIS